jgi:hypothetical protein
VWGAIGKLLYVGLKLVMPFHPCHRPVSTSCRMGPMSGPFSCSVPRATESQPPAATAPIAHTSFMSALVLTLWQCVHSWQGHLERALALLCFRPWWCSEVMLYSCRRWIQHTVCPFRFLKLMSQVSAEWSMRRWNCCPYRYLWICSSVLTMTGSSRRVTVISLCFD